MTKPNFITYGCFKDLCEQIFDGFLSDSEDDSPEKHLFDSVAPTLNEDGKNGFLAYSLVKSAQMGLRFPHLDHDALTHGNTEETAAYLNRHGIREITVEGRWSSFDEILDAFIKQGWTVEGIHYLPERYKENYGGSRRSIHLFRPALSTPKEDWED